MTILLRLAWRNVTLNVNRSLLAILAMALAAAILTGATAMPTGYTTGAYARYRVLFGADILVFPGEFRFTHAGSDPALVCDWPTLAAPPELTFFYPNIIAEGQLRRLEERRLGLPLDGLLVRAAAVPGVAAVTPRLIWPALRVVADDETGAVIGLRPVRLIGRYLEGGGAEALATLVPGVTGTRSYGRSLTVADAGSRVALVNVYAPQPETKVGDQLDLLLPALAGYWQGAPSFDFSRVNELELLAVGRYQAPTELLPADRTIPGFGVPGMSGADELPAPVIQFYWSGEDVFVPASTWLALFEEVNGEPLQAVPAFGVTVDDMLQSKLVAAELQRALPGVTVITVPEAAGGMLTRRGQALAAWDATRYIVALCWLVAGLLLAGNMHVLALQRRRELGVLKAIGASGLELFILLLTEALVFGLVGATVGFVCMRLVWVGLLAFTTASFSQIALETLRVGARILSWTVGVSLAFGIWPALRATRESTIVVLGQTEA